MDIHEGKIPEKSVEGQLSFEQPPLIIISDKTNAIGLEKLGVEQAEKKTGKRASIKRLSIKEVVKVFGPQEVLSKVKNTVEHFQVKEAVKEAKELYQNQQDPEYLNKREKLVSQLLKFKDQDLNRAEFRQKLAEEFPKDKEIHKFIDELFVSLKEEGKQEIKIIESQGDQLQILVEIPKGTLQLSGDVVSVTNETKVLSEKEKEANLKLRTKVLQEIQKSEKTFRKDALLLAALLIDPSDQEKIKEFKGFASKTGAMDSIFDDFLNMKIPHEELFQNQLEKEILGPDFFEKVTDDIFAFLKVSDDFLEAAANPLENEKLMERYFTAMTPLYHLQKLIDSSYRNSLIQEKYLRPLYKEKNTDVSLQKFFGALVVIFVQRTPKFLLFAKEINKTYEENSIEKANALKTTENLEKKVDGFNELTKDLEPIDNFLTSFNETMFLLSKSNPKEASSLQKELKQMETYFLANSQSAKEFTKQKIDLEKQKLELEKELQTLEKLLDMKKELDDSERLIPIFLKKKEALSLKAQVVQTQIEELTAKLTAFTPLKRKVETLKQKAMVNLFLQNKKIPNQKINLEQIEPDVFRKEVNRHIEERLDLKTLEKQLKQAKQEITTHASKLEENFSSLELLLKIIPAVDSYLEGKISSQNFLKALKKDKILQEGFTIYLKQEEKRFSLLGPKLDELKSGALKDQLDKWKKIYQTRLQVKEDINKQKEIAKRAKGISDTIFLIKEGNSFLEEIVIKYLPFIEQGVPGTFDEMKNKIKSELVQLGKSDLEQEEKNSQKQRLENFYQRFEKIDLFPKRERKQQIETEELIDRIKKDPQFSYEEVGLPLKFEEYLEKAISLTTDAEEKKNLSIALSLWAVFEKEEEGNRKKAMDPINQFYLKGNQGVHELADLLVKKDQFLFSILPFKEMTSAKDFVLYTSLWTRNTSNVGNGFMEFILQNREDWENRLQFVVRVGTFLLDQKDRDYSAIQAVFNSVRNSFIYRLRNSIQSSKIRASYENFINQGEILTDASQNDQAIRKDQETKIKEGKQIIPAMNLYSKDVEFTDTKLPAILPKGQVKEGEIFWSRFIHLEEIFQKLQKLQEDFTGKEEIKSPFDRYSSGTDIYVIEKDLEQLSSAIKPRK